MSVVPLRLNENAPTSVRGGVVAIGNFDGVHRGHAALIAEARNLARGGITIPVTFDPHPLLILSPNRYQPPLTTMAERSRLLESVGANHVVVLQTTRELLSLSPVQFFDKIIRRTLEAKGIVEGFNFRFGRDRTGSNDTLFSLCASGHIEFREVPAFEEDGRPVSSSRVRDALQTGEVKIATRLLGRPYRTIGRVGVGAKRGRTIGFPTANLEQVQTVVPVGGVYAVKVQVADREFMGAANIGANPTFGESSRKIEVHLIDFDENLYGRELAIDFIARLRDTKKFVSADALTEQLRSDVAAARKELSNV